MFLIRTGFPRDRRVPERVRLQQAFRVDDDSTGFARDIPPGAHFPGTKNLLPLERETILRSAGYFSGQGSTVSRSQVFGKIGVAIIEVLPGRETGGDATKVRPPSRARLNLTEIPVKHNERSRRCGNEISQGTAGDFCACEFGGFDRIEHNFYLGSDLRSAPATPDKLGTILRLNGCGNNPDVLFNCAMP